MRRRKKKSTIQKLHGLKNKKMNMQHNKQQKKKNGSKMS
jgi:hypothetical protein